MSSVNFFLFRENQRDGLSKILGGSVKVVKDNVTGSVKIRAGLSDDFTIGRNGMQDREENERDNDRQ